MCVTAQLAWLPTPFIDGVLMRRASEVQLTEPPALEQYILSPCCTFVHYV